MQTKFSLSFFNDPNGKGKGVQTASNKTINNKDHLTASLSSVIICVPTSPDYRINHLREERIIVVGGWS